MAVAPDARSLGDLFAELSREVTALVRAELALARTELGQKLSRAARHAATAGAGAVVALAGVFTLAASLVLILIEVGVPAWAAALIVGLGLAATGALVAKGALAALQQDDLTPSETIQTLKESTTWTRQTN